MKKEKEIKIITVISAVLSASVAVFGCICVLFPDFALSLYKMFYGGGINVEATITKKADAVMFIRSLSPLLYTAIAAFNALTDNYSKGKGIATIVCTSVAYISINFISTFLYALAAKMSGGADAVMTISIINTVVSQFAMLNIFAIMTLVSVSSVEIYASCRNNEKI